MARSTRSGYTFTNMAEPSNYTVGRGEQMRAAIGNNDFLAEGKCDGLRGSSDTAASQNKDGMAVVHVIGYDYEASATSGSIVLVNSGSDYGNTNLSDSTGALKYRYIHVFGTCFRSNTPATAMPGDTNDSLLDIQGASHTTTYLMEGHFYSGSGYNAGASKYYYQPPVTDVDMDTYLFYVDPTSGDVIFEWNFGVTGSHGVAYSLFLEFSPLCQVP